MEAKLRRLVNKSGVPPAAARSHVHQMAIISRSMLYAAELTWNGRKGMRVPGCRRVKGKSLPIDADRYSRSGEQAGTSQGQGPATQDHRQLPAGQQERDRFKHCDRGKYLNDPVWRASGAVAGHRTPSTD